jgi:hypothetical protein
MGSPPHTTCDHHAVNSIALAVSEVYHIEHAVYLKCIMWQENLDKFEIIPVVQGYKDIGVHWNVTIFAEPESTVKE